MNKVKISMQEKKESDEATITDWEGQERTYSAQKSLFLFGSHFAGLLSATELMQQVGELTDSTFEEVQESHQKYEKAAEALKPFKLMLNLWTSELFGNKDAHRFLTHGGDIEVFLKSNNPLPEKIKALRETTDTLSESRQFFHWELEFPEVFYKGTREKENAGFDVIIGNPPWGAALENNEKKYLGSVYPTTAKNFDTYVAMIEKNVGMLRRGGTLGSIVPDAWLTGVSYIPLRRFLLTNGVLLDFVNLPYDVFSDAYVDSATMVFEKRDPGANPIFGKVKVINFGKRDRVTDINLHVSKRVYFDYSLWANDPYLAFRISLSSGDYSIEKKLSDNVIPLQSIADIDRGLEAYSKYRQSPDEIKRKIYHSASKIGESYIKQFQGTLRRYLISEDGELWVKWGSHLAEYPAIEFFEKPRILLRRLISRQFRIMAAFAEDKFANDSSTFDIILRDERYNLFFVLAILNSTLFSHFQVKRSQLAQRDDFPKLSLEEARSFPIRKITFQTSPKERANLLEKTKSLYARCMAKNDFLCITGSVEHYLEQKPEQTDVVHDLLAFLAQQMIELNKQVLIETKGFLQWLEITIGAKVGTLKNKTKLSTYHEGSLEELLEVVKENRKTLKINPVNKEFFDLLKDAFEKSLAKLSPLKHNIATTDRLIDLIVYRLYGLTNEEVKMVEGELE